jgi:hypothetical protein
MEKLFNQKSFVSFFGHLCLVEKATYVTTLLSMEVAQNSSQDLPISRRILSLGK